VPAALAAGWLGLSATAAAAVSWPHLTVTLVAEGFDLPVHVTHAGDGSGRLFVVEQPGRIRLVSGGGVAATPFLDISDRVTCCGERGLLSVAFPPGFASKHYFYVDYINLSGDSVVSRFFVSAGNPNLADPASEQVVITIDQPDQAGFTNHKGGQLAFGADGFLYISLGDGGSGGDPGNRAQNPATLLGKILRLDVESNVAPYAVPADNPFVGQPGFLPEIWALGMRNPWRLAFDRMTGDLYIGDVGQGAWEEIDFQPVASNGGENYGWRIMEGNHCFNPPTNCMTAGLVPPVWEYDHGQGCSVTGGTVYRGTAQARMGGIYFYSDYCSGRIWGLQRDGQTWVSKLLLDTPFAITSFGEDEAGEVYFVNHSPGTLYRLRHSLAPADFNSDGVSGLVVYRAGSWYFFTQ
jgi:glucose/arabinose dehydrogenase